MDVTPTERTVAALVALLFVAAVVTVVLAGPASAHPGPVDARGGHICRPVGAGLADCARFGLAPGEYHCETDACRLELLERAQDWCWFGIPYPTHSSLIGLYPEEPFTPPIHVVRLGTVEHVLRVVRDIEPQVSPPGDCFTLDPTLPLELTSSAVAAHQAADGEPAPFAAAEPVVAASTGIEPLEEDGSAWTWAAAAAAFGTLLGARALRRRRRVHWES